MVRPTSTVIFKWIGLIHTEFKLESSMTKLCVGILIVDLILI